MAFTWPTRDLIDDRGELYGTGDPLVWPGTGRLDTYRFSAGILAMLGDPMAPMMHKYARDAKTALDVLHAADTTDWTDFLFWIRPLQTRTMRAFRSPIWLQVWAE